MGGSGIMFANVSGFLALGKRDFVPTSERQLIAAEVVGSLGLTSVRDKLIVAWAINSLLLTQARLTYNTAMTLLDMPAEPRMIWRANHFFPYSYTSLEAKSDTITKHIRLSTVTKTNHNVNIDLVLVCGVVEDTPRTQRFLKGRQLFDLKQIPLLADMETASAREGSKTVISK